MTFKYKALLIFFLANLPQLALALTVEGLYSATVNVSDQSSTQRQKGFSLALKEVLIKTTGAKDITAHRGVGQALAQANNYMVKYAYLQQLESDSSFEDELPSDDQLQPSAEQSAIEKMPVGFRLSVQFAKASIDELIRTLGLPIWPSNRPQILVWVVEQTTSGYRFADVDELPESLQSSFERRGLPFQLPLYDLGDRMALAPSAAWSLNQQQLQDAAERYRVDHWLVLRYSQLATGGVSGSWYLSGLTKDFTVDDGLLNTLHATSNEEFLSVCVDQVADRFVQQMSYFADTKTDLFRLVVENVGDFRAFTQLNNFLEGLEIVNAVNVRSIEGDTVVLDLSTEGDPRVLLRALNKESRLSPVRQMGNDDIEFLRVNSPPSISSPNVNPAVPPMTDPALISPPSVTPEYFRWQAARF